MARLRTGLVGLLGLLGACTEESSGPPTSTGEFAVEYAIVDGTVRTGELLVTEVRVDVAILDPGCELGLHSVQTTPLDPGGAFRHVVTMLPLRQDRLYCLEFRVARIRDGEPLAEPVRIDGVRFESAIETAPTLNIELILLQDEE